MCVSDGGDNRSRYQEAEVRLCCWRRQPKCMRSVLPNCSKTTVPHSAPIFWIGSAMSAAEGASPSTAAWISIVKMTRVNAEIRAEYILQPATRDTRLKFHRVSLRFPRPREVKPIYMSL